MPDFARTRAYVPIDGFIGKMLEAADRKNRESRAQQQKQQAIKNDQPKDRRSAIHCKSPASSE
jgi:hypothetical protein